MQKGKPVPLQIVLVPIAPADVTIVSQPTGASLWINREDGEPAGVTPWRGRLKVGSHFVLLRKDEHRDKRVSFTVDANNPVSLEVDLEPLAPLAPPGPPPPKPEELTLRDPPKPPPAETRLQRTIGWIALGAGAVGLIGGGALTLLAIDTHEDSKRLRQDEPEDKSITLREIRNRESDAQSYQTASFIAYGAGGVIAAVGAAVMILDTPEPRSDNTVGLVATQQGLALGWRF